MMPPLFPPSPAARGPSLLRDVDPGTLRALSGGLMFLAYGAVALALLWCAWGRRSPRRWALVVLGPAVLVGGIGCGLAVQWLWGAAEPAADWLLAVGIGAVGALLPACILTRRPPTVAKLGRANARAPGRAPPGTDHRRRLALAAAHSPSVVLIIGRDGRIEYCNPAYYKLTGQHRVALGEKRASLWTCGILDPAAYREVRDALSAGRIWEGERLTSNAQGQRCWYRQYLTPLWDAPDQVSYYLLIAQDITDLKNAAASSRRLAFFDLVTGLPNRTLFRARLEQTHRRAAREGTAFAVMYLDLDRFKHINDSLNHRLGDQVLAAVGKRLRRCLGSEATVARLGGDEFAVLLPNLAHGKMAGAAATAILEALKAPFQIAGRSLFATASIGISLYPDDHHDLDQLLKMADAAMDKAKELGRNRCQFFQDTPRARGERRLALETGLRYALERGELEIYYQPKFELADGRCYAAEALLRWRRPGHGLVGPAQFVPIAEDIGLIVPIGEWLLGAVCRQMAAWQAAGLDLAVAVNLSAQQFQQKNLLRRLDAVLEETRINRARLELEITESAAMHDPEHTAEVLRSMKQRGLTLALDDFGVGYSSLSYLQRFPLDTLKIDQSFVRQLGAGSDGARIIRAMIALAHSLDLMVVAEGVETEAQAEFLRRCRCDWAQGYLYSPPLPAEDFARWVRQQRADVASPTG
ncbi:putative bifunctional diguanylate cyclase/phosphodiesterase [Candidatus Methylocalor cossyra]|uniref:PAS domain S-box-containing protein/diguanylate cyclase (GGDEF) domain-containing protein n=1 Tax=Candidatus Methylocalor cossyra TaxID=3108543 RepID=A0ABM9NJ99_9GAMM